MLDKTRVLSHLAWQDADLGNDFDDLRRELGKSFFLSTIIASKHTHTAWGHEFSFFLSLSLFVMSHHLSFFSLPCLFLSGRRVTHPALMFTSQKIRVLTEE